MATRRIEQPPKEKYIKKQNKPEVDDFLKTKITELNKELGQLRAENEKLKKSNGENQISFEIEEEMDKLNTYNISLETELKDAQDEIEILTDANSELVTEKEKINKELEMASSRVDQLQKSLETTMAKNKELKEMAVQPSPFPEEVRISKIGKSMIEDDGTIFIACKVKTKEDGPLETTTLCGNLSAFKGLVEKAEAASEEEEA